MPTESWAEYGLRCTKAGYGQKCLIPGIHKDHSLEAARSSFRKDKANAERSKQLNIYVHVYIHTQAVPT